MFDGITNKGSEYLAKCQVTGEGIKIVKIKIGDGRILDEEDHTTFIDIKSIKKEAKISEKAQIDNALRLVIEFNNEEVETGYFPREIGVYAQDGENEILYWYINEGEETSWMPPSEKTPVNFKYGLNIIATNNETTIINWTGRDLWINKETFEIEMEKKQNKGNVSEEFDTAEKIEKLLKGNSGIASVIYIQDVGTKTYGKGYIDKETGELYMCIVESTESVDVDENFRLATNIANTTVRKILFENLSGTNAKSTLNENISNFDLLIFTFKYSGGAAMTRTMPVIEFREFGFGYDMRGGENADRYYGASINYISDTEVQATGRLSLFKIIGYKF